METRRMEYQRLKSLLEEKNMLEREMTLSEMRELANILEQSEKDCVDDEENWSIPSNPSSLKSKENEMEFEDGYVQEICNSTMISAHDQPSATQLHLESRELGEDALPFNSPDRPSRIFTIRAEVHRPGNWSPPRARRGPDFTGGGGGDGGGDAEHTRNEPMLIMARHNPKQQQVEPVPECLRNDSGVNCSNNTSDEMSGSIVDDSLASSANDHTGDEESHASAAEDSRASAEGSVELIDLTHIDYDEDEENTSL